MWGIVAMLLYHSVNAYTDLRWRVTKNIWHLLFFTGGLAMSIRTVWGAGAGEIFWFYALGLFLWFFIGVFFEQAIGMYSPGDTKMMVVSALWLSSLSGLKNYSETLVIFGLAIAFSLLVAGMFAMVRTYGLKKTVETLRFVFLVWSPLFMTKLAGLVQELKRMRKQIDAERKNPKMVVKNIPAAIPIAAGTVFTLFMSQP